MSPIPKPDSGYSWIIALCCFYLHFALFGLFRSSGVVYVAMIETYHVPREDASWPFSICAGVFQLIAPATSILSRYMSLRATALFGSVIATTGIAACYFAQSVMWINVFYGVVHGIGFGIVTTVVPVVLHQYFVKHVTTAMGLALAGGTLSSMVSPIVMEWLLYHYDLRDSFLILSGVVMNMLVASALLRAPPWLHPPGSKARECSELKDSGVSVSEGTEGGKTTPNVYTVVEGDRGSGRRLSSDEINMNTTTTCAGGDGAGTPLPQDDTMYSNDSILFGDANADVENGEIKSGAEKTDLEVRKPLMTVEKISIAPARKPKDLDEDYDLSTRHSLVLILKAPMFHMITFTMAVFFFGAHAFFMVIVDFAKDKGISDEYAVYILSVFSLTDMVGRAGLGWVTDRKYLERSTLLALNLTALGIIYNMYPIVVSLNGMLIVAAFHGIVIGSCVTLYFVLLADCFGAQRLTLVIGMCSFVNGLLSFLRPGIIGLFRDVVGSYDWMFHFSGLLSLLWASIWLIRISITKL